MKKLGIFILALFVVAGSGTLYGQEKKSRKQRKTEQTERAVKQLIDAQKYIFIGTNPLAPTVESRTAKIYIIVTKEYIESPLLVSNKVMNQKIYFEDFEYKVEDSENGGWDIYIKIEDESMPGLPEIHLRVYPDGKADLLKGTFYNNNIIGYIEGPKRNGNF